ncbi:Crp/Fnr family transcriptional regulator [Patescibacteria group bacterium]|nr:Crp/Fnr family transcriptional regulator [Patescibacteria group bacterium]
MDKIWYLKQLDIFKELAPKDIADIGVIVDEKNVSKKEIILEPEDKDKVYIIKRGQVKLYQLTEDGKRVIIDTLGPGGVFGNFGSDDQGQNFAQATSDTFICIAKKNTFFDTISQKPDVSSKLMMMLFDQITQARDYIAAMAGGNVLSKLKYKLTELGGKYGEEKSGKVKITQRFTHEEIADMIGVSRETITKLLGSLRRRGIIELEGKNIVFHKEKLEAA